ncbi:coiled-coil domain-containing protein [Sesbania bispinosa]|nr:coiled-coil domain-containing protein [Sesbania bispinosa]
MVPPLTAQQSSYGQPSAPRNAVGGHLSHESSHRSTRPCRRRRSLSLTQPRRFSFCISPSSPSSSNLSITGATPSPLVSHLPQHAP